MALNIPELGDNVLQTDIDQTEAINNLINIFYPIGTIYESTNSTNPSEFMGGTWERYGNGRVTVGLDVTQTEFNTVDKTGGEKTHILSDRELPAVPYRANADVRHAGGWFTGSGTKFALTEGNGYLISVVPNLGQGLAHNNLQPYITVYRFRRTA